MSRSCPPRVAFVASALLWGTAGCQGQILGDLGDIDGTMVPGPAGAAGSLTPSGLGGSGGVPGAGSAPGVGSVSGAGNMGGSMTEVPPGNDPVPGPPLRTVGARRLTRQEFSRSVRRLLGPEAPIDVTMLPEDTLTPFDNDVLEQSPSMALVEATEAISRDLAIWSTAAPARIAAVAPCAATTPDANCFSSFLQTFGKRVLRRPLAQDEIAGMADLFDHAKAPGTFADALRMAMRVFLQHPEFIYRVEPGMGKVGPKIRLTSFEVASRMSFLLQGMTPDDRLLKAAEDGMLATPEGALAEAKRLLAAEEGKEQIRRFHAFWLGYANLNQLPVQKKMRTESDALVDRATEAGRDFRSLFLADDTRIDPELAVHYGIPMTGAAFEWVSYAAAPRRGILSHGLFAAAGAKFTDTSPTRRGKFVRERMLCQVVPPPPAEANVDVDLPPEAKTPDACKTERYRQHREHAECAGCHALMDPIGFGLENFDELGRYRTHDKDRPACLIDGKGSLDADTPFTGAKELATLIANSPQLNPCVGEHFIRFAAGRKLDAVDVRRAQWLGGEMKKNNNAFAAMVLAYVTHENFRHREE